MSMGTLGDERVSAYLDMLGNPSPTIDLSGLTRLQQAHLLRVPFHNLELLSNDGNTRHLPAIEEVVDSAILGIGGTWT